MFMVGNDDHHKKESYFFDDDALNTLGHIQSSTCVLGKQRHSKVYTQGYHQQIFENPDMVNVWKPVSFSLYVQQKQQYHFQAIYHVIQHSLCLFYHTRNAFLILGFPLRRIYLESFEIFDVSLRAF